ncbi:hypothetical protein BJ170DRAFT_367711 [Xylariales sp. AK1849]|nr:hypothetical protein BJ170DRAFT_367711 [Xylariales sp. AK1849]
MGSHGLNYFTCTLGQAALWRQSSREHQKSFSTVLELIEEQAKDVSDSPALGFADYSSNGSRKRPLLVTFKELCDLSNAAAIILAKDVPSCVGKKDTAASTVGLLCTSSLDFVLTWLGLMRLGHTVFLLAPQLEPSAITHLCEISRIKTVFIDKSQQHREWQLNGHLSIKALPYYFRADLSCRPIRRVEGGDPTSDLAYLRHTSGTSSGLPKPIHQSHWGAVGALPRLEGNSSVATFSTTPLYHGGLADCFRAWTSAAMIWFFPEGSVPVTEANVIKAVRYARAKSSVQVGYFTCVPYILQALAQDAEGIDLLQGMKTVGVGGAALAPSVGDKLVNGGVNLVSRMGSAECGFLMSSDRDYSTDTEWQYLRAVDDSRLLAFEPREDGLYELVAGPDWPLRAKTNRNDGSYATSDLFQPHPTIQNAWRYHSRSDAQITLANGKKFDPSPIEGALLASTEMLRDVLVFGTGRDYPGALLFPASNGLTKESVARSVWSEVQRVNKESQSHARLDRSALVVVPQIDGEAPLDKSSKGTILRRQAEERYADFIESAYQEIGDGSAYTQHIVDDEITAVISEMFTQVLGREVNTTQDLFQQGVDSIACIQVRRSIETALLPSEAGSLPLNIIYEQGTVTALAAYVIRARRGNSGRVHSVTKKTDEEDLNLMPKMVDMYSDFGFCVPAVPVQQESETVILTGATGLLGSHILHLLRGSSGVTKVYCLLRAQTHYAAHERVSKALSKRGMAGLGGSTSYPDFDNKIVCLPWNLFDQDIELPCGQRKSIIEEATLVIHAAWTVNFSLRLSSFEDQISGTHNLLKFAMISGARFFFISSTAAVSCSSGTTIPETTSSYPSDASPLGYARSKWVAERICATVDESFRSVRVNNSRSIPRVTILRVGQLCGSTDGIWNASEAYPLMLSTAAIVGCLPDIKNESLDWLPVDQAARAVLEIALEDHDYTPQTTTLDASTTETSLQLPIYHILNPHKTPTWHDMLHWLLDEDIKCDFEIVQPPEWVNRLEKALERDAAGHPSQKLLAFWKDMFSSGNTDNRIGSPDGQVISKKPVVFELAETSHSSKSIASLKPLDRETVLRMWHWICNNVAIQS